MTDPIKVLFAIPARHHREIALDEMVGLRDLGYTCDQFSYASKTGQSSNIGRLLLILRNAFILIIKSYRFKPDIIFINSRLEVLGSTRDCITIFVVKTFYYNKVLFFIKSHGSDIEVVKANSFFINRMVLPFLKKNVSAWLFLSREERESINAINYFCKSRVFVTKNIVRTDQFKYDADFRRKLNIPADHKILLFVGRIIQEKGIHEVIDSYVRIKKKHKVVLIIVGDGIELTEIRNKITRYNISDGVILTGEFIPEPETIKYYANSDVLVFPTFFPEGFAMALFNSVAAGLSIVTTPVRAAVDFLSEPENCLWVLPRDSDSVYTALDRLLTNHIFMKQMKKNNRKKGEIFSKKYVSHELSQIIKTVIR